MSKLAAAIVSLALSACAGRSADKSSYELRVRVEGDVDHALAGVPLLRGAARVGVTNQAGVALLQMAGREGERVELRAVCPETHHSPATPSVALLRSYVAQRAPELAIRCLPRKRQLAVVVMAKNAPDLPLLYRGSEIGRTDATGTAHLALESEPGHAFEVTLDTSSRPDLHPQLPGGRFVIAARDEAVLFDPALTVTPRRRRHVVKPGPLLPQRIR